MSVIMPAGCERLLTSRILVLMIELGLQFISGAVSTSDMSPPIQIRLDPWSHPPSLYFLHLDSGFASWRLVYGEGQRPPEPAIIHSFILFSSSSRGRARHGTLSAILMVCAP